MFTVLSLPGARFAEVSLEALAKEDERRFGTPQRSRLLDPVYCQQLLDEEHKRLGVTNSYGDYLVNRQTAWRGGYQELYQTFIHLGVDIAAAEGTPVLAPQAGVIERLDTDTDQDGGWGSRVFLRLLDKGDHVLLLAHLRDDFQVKRGQYVEQGAPLGFLASPERNGGWFSHLHVQTINSFYWPRIAKALQKDQTIIDGYCGEVGRATKVWFPDPMPYIRKP